MRKLLVGVCLLLGCGPQAKEESVVRNVTRCSIADAQPWPTPELKSYRFDFTYDVARFETGEILVSCSTDGFGASSASRLWLPSDAEAKTGECRFGSNTSRLTAAKREEWVFTMNSAQGIATFSADGGVVLRDDGSGYSVDGTVIALGCK